jgi:hypothetical protein
MLGSIPETGGALGQSHDKHREPKRKLVTNKKHLSLTPRQIGTATPHAQLSLGSSIILARLSKHLLHLAPIDAGTELFRMIDKASFAASNIYLHHYSGFLEIRVKAALASALPLRARKIHSNEITCVSLPSPNSLSACTLANIRLALLLGLPAKNSFCALGLKTNSANLNARASAFSALHRT